MQRIKNEIKNTKLSSKSLTEGCLRKDSVCKGERSLQSSVFVSIKQGGCSRHSQAYRVRKKIIKKQKTNYE